ncbi:MATH domain and coiled-coil domain-containing protein At2g42470-like isoform X4 [Brassica napus]|uniref:MATH domain and coiled-coil domain-containing protein At2g42470-like isoform X4 n=1 Tax=Brassica napus TaxID=3708 RepID=UPI00207AFB30|nr:MATH domain and coiled-coil domain-containing protein At2g42470-like isoform X4 [Brassica napus]
MLGSIVVGWSLVITILVKIMSESKTSSKMGTELDKALSLEIDNFSERTNVMKSVIFSSGGCNWFLCVCAGDHLSMYLQDVNTHRLRSGWKRRVSFCFVLLNQSGKELFRSPDEGRRRLFCAETPSWGLGRTLPLTKLQEKGFLEKNKLTIEVYMKVFEVVHQGKSTENDVLDYNGFNIIASQAGPIKDIFSELAELKEAGFKLDWLDSRLEEISLERKKLVSDGPWVKKLEEQIKSVELTLSDLKVELDKERIKSIIAGPVEYIFVTHPDFALDVIPMNQGMKTAYMNLISNLAKALRKCPRIVTELKEAGFKFDWLKSRLEEISLENKKVLSGGPSVKQLEEQVTNVELNLSDLKVELDKDMIKSIISSQTGPVRDIFVQQPDCEVDFILKNQGMKTEYMNLLLGLVGMLRKSPQSLSVTELNNAQSELTVLKEAGFNLDWLNSRLQEVSLERNKTMSDGSRVQQLEGRMKNVELTLSDLKDELDTERIKSAAKVSSSFGLLDFFIKRFFLSCFSFSKY